MKLPTFILILCLSLFSCSNPSETVVEETTPEVFTQKDIMDDSYTSRSYHPDIIQKLFNEAVKKDADLKALTSSLRKTRELSSDSMARYVDYVSNNQDYWNALNSYSNQLSDSSMRDELDAMINTLKEEHTQQTAPLDQLASQISDAQMTLHDLEILMKIMVTAPMMANYQKNELPDIQQLESVKAALESSLKEIEPYAKIQK